MRCCFEGCESHESCVDQRILELTRGSISIPLCFSHHYMIVSTPQPGETRKFEIRIGNGLHVVEKRSRYEISIVVHPVIDGVKHPPITALANPALMPFDGLTHGEAIKRLTEKGIKPGHPGDSEVL